MNHTLTFRLLLVTFVSLYVAALFTSGVSPAAPVEVIAFEKWLQSQANDDSSVWGLLCALGHISDLIGVVLLFLRRRLGLWFLLAGFVSCLGAGAGGLPYLQTSLSANLIGFTNITWGAIVALSLAIPERLFVSKNDT